MVMMDLRDLLRDILGSYRVQFLALREQCTVSEASALDFQFRDQLYESFDYAGFAASVMALVPEDNVIDYRDDFGLHYLVFRDRDRTDGAYAFCGPYTYHAFSETEWERLIGQHDLHADSMEALRWYFKRIPVIEDYLLTNKSRDAHIQGVYERFLRLCDGDEERARQITYDHRARPENIQAFYDEVETRYGSMEGLIHEQLAISEADRERFRASCTTSAQ